MPAKKQPPANTVPIVYVGPFDEVEVDGLPDVVVRGEQFDCPLGVAGTAPSVVLVDDLEEHDPGSGLLAQPDNWQPAAPEKKGS